jgi:hypothetical protein
MPASAQLYFVFLRFTQSHRVDFAIPSVRGLVGPGSRPGFCALVAVGFPVPASRPCWKGCLKLSFSCPIALCPAISTAERISGRSTGEQAIASNRKLVVSVTGQAKGSADKARGYEVGETNTLAPIHHGTDSSLAASSSIRMAASCRGERFRRR